jgi:hypothetical protein
MGRHQGALRVYLGCVHFEKYARLREECIGARRGVPEAAVRTVVATAKPGAWEHGSGVPEPVRRKYQRRCLDEKVQGVQSGAKQHAYRKP